jgi:hypothetical protein
VLVNSQKPDVAKFNAFSKVKYLLEGDGCQIALKRTSFSIKERQSFFSGNSYVIDFKKP